MREHSHHQGRQSGTPGPTALDENQHVPGDNVNAEYERAYREAQPDSGRSVVTVALDAREVDWTVDPGQTFRAWGFNGQMPGPTIEARVGDVLEV